MIRRRSWRDRFVSESFESKRINHCLALPSPEKDVTCPRNWSRADGPLSQSFERLKLIEHGLGSIVGWPAEDCGFNWRGSSCLNPSHVALSFWARRVSSEFCRWVKIVSAEDKNSLTSVPSVGLKTGIFWRNRFSNSDRLCWTSCRSRISSASDIVGGERETEEGWSSIGAKVVSCFAEEGSVITDSGPWFVGGSDRFVHVERRSLIGVSVRFGVERGFIGGGDTLIGIETKCSKPGSPFVMPRVGECFYSGSLSNTCSWSCKHTHTREHTLAHHKEKKSRPTVRRRRKWRMNERKENKRPQKRKKTNNEEKRNGYRDVV